MLEYLLVANENDDEAAADALIEFVERRARAFTASESEEEGEGATAGTATGSSTRGSSTNAGKSVSRKAEAARKPFVNLIPYNPTSAGDRFG